MSQPQPTQSDVDAAWAALQPLCAAYAAAQEAHLLAQAAWVRTVREARKAPGGPAPAKLARTGAALQTAHAAYWTTYAAYQVGGRTCLGRAALAGRIGAERRHGAVRLYTLVELSAIDPAQRTLPTVPAVPDAVSAGLRWVVWGRDQFTCQACGCRQHLTTDHIYPVSRGGLSVLANLQTLCTRCNSKKGNRFGPQEHALLWTRLIALEPRLGDLLSRAGAIHDDPARPAFCANARWFGYYGHPSLKAALVELVGWDAHTADPLLRSTVAFDVAYRRVYAALPDCRNCACIGMGSET